MEVEDEFKEPKRRIYLPAAAQEEGLDTKNYLKHYIKREFPAPNAETCEVYSIPDSFEKIGEKQATLAEKEVFLRIQGLSKNSKIGGTWITFFHNISYGGKSFRNQRVGKLIIREHDFVLFVKQQKKYFVVLIEVKSTNDQNTPKSLEKISDAKVIKNNKRSAQHQLRDHLEILDGVLGKKSESGVQTYIMWPFLGAYTKDSKHQMVQRWKEEGDLHVFENVLGNQENFDLWFGSSVLGGVGVNEDDFCSLLNRFVVLSCGAFVNEIDRKLMILLTKEQLRPLHLPSPRPLVVHGAAGTGKTLLVLRKLEQLHQSQRLGPHHRALYVCYWPGIRQEVELKLESLGIRAFVDTARFYITTQNFLEGNSKTYKHIFMDEAEAICLALDGRVIEHTVGTIFQKYHDGNCEMGCHVTDQLCDGVDESWGELWFMVDINQASMFLPKHSPRLLKTPDLTLTKVMRSTGFIFKVFKEFYAVPMPQLPKNLQDNMKIPEITMGHGIDGPPVYWVESKNGIDRKVAHVVIDLCTCKGFKAHDLCVIPFLINDQLTAESINGCIDEEFMEKSFRPIAIKDVEEFLVKREVNTFLVTWALKLKGLEFKVVVMAIDRDDFDLKDAEDRKKAYIMASRCTSMLVIVGDQSVKRDMDVEGLFENYSFSSF